MRAPGITGAAHTAHGCPIERVSAIAEQRSRPSPMRAICLVFCLGSPRASLRSKIKKEERSMDLAMLAPAPDFRYVGVTPVKTTAAHAMLRDVLGCAVLGAIGGWTCVPFGHGRAATVFLGAVTGGAL